MKSILPSTLFVFVAVTFLLSACNGNNDTEMAAVSSKDSIDLKLQRGNYLVHSVVNCIDCHSKFDFDKFSIPIIPGTEGGGGFAVHELIQIPGKIYVPNITPAALKEWTDEEIARAITKGINKKGDTLFPMMPYHGLSRMAKEDVDAVIAYIRTLKPIENKFPERQLFVPASAFGPLPNNDYKNNTLPDSTDKLKYGEYLVTIAHCTDCHTPVNEQMMPVMDKFSRRTKP